MKPASRPPVSLSSADVSDPNWFYSTMAQSSAAIVGLAGGFMVSRIISVRETIAEDRRIAKERFNALMGEVMNLRARAIAHAELARNSLSGAPPIDVGKLTSFSSVNPVGEDLQRLNEQQLADLANFADIADDLAAELPASDPALLERLKEDDDLRPRTHGWLADPPNDPTFSFQRQTPTRAAISACFIPSAASPRTSAICASFSLTGHPQLRICHAPVVTRGETRPATGWGGASPQWCRATPMHQRRRSRQSSRPNAERVGPSVAAGGR
jgi:hypothetical protein